ncbi:hypothetical protein [Candidatus Nitrosocosmicus franklandus]|uniref:hypothetical protein n=1 Tax=Candidatus Nitrosocosmicus franklandianus TaxID=1798806 RepID=UPI00106C16C9|nr:hypothetical protein [Candidatus Nitrosocosmicus franklandus]
MSTPLTSLPLPRFPLPREGSYPPCQKNFRVLNNCNYTKQKGMLRHDMLDGVVGSSSINSGSNNGRRNRI